MKIEKIKEFKNFMEAAGEDIEGIEKMLESEQEILEFSAYMQNLRSDCKQAIGTLSGEKKAEYEKRLENLTKALEIIYLFAL